MGMDRQVFSNYVRSLDSAGQPPDPQNFDDLWSALGQALRNELKKRGLWDTSPSFLGVYGYESWHSRAVVTHETSAQALEELLAGCYAHIFVRRLGGLKAQLAIKPNIDGLVFLGIRNFLHDLQKRHDPLGFRVFEILRSAIRGALKAGDVALLGGDRRIRNDTLLGVAGPSAPSVEGDAGSEERLEVTVKGWNDTLLPDLVTARGEARVLVIARLQSLVIGLPEDGFHSFTFKQIIEPLKNDARARWGALLDLEEGETALDSLEEGSPVMVRRTPASAAPDVELEEHDSYDRLVSCVSERIDRRARSAADSHAMTSGGSAGGEVASGTQYLSRLWEFLHTRSGATRNPAAATAARVEMAGASDDEQLSARKLGKLLHIPRERIPSLFDSLRQLVDRCRPANPEKPPVNSYHEGEDSRG